MINIYEKDSLMKNKITKENLDSLRKFQLNLNKKYGETANIIKNSPGLIEKVEIALIVLSPYLEEDEEVYYDAKIKNFNISETN